MSTNCERSTYDRYKSVIENHLIPDMGSVALYQLKPIHLQTHYARALKEGRKKSGPSGGLAAWTVRKHHVILREALSHAVKWGLLGRNVALVVDPPRTPRSEGKALYGDSSHRILEAAMGTIWHPIFHLALHTGLRRGEILALRWKDVDLDVGELYLSQAMVQLDDGTILIKEPKSARGRRRLALSPEAVKSLWSHQERQVANFMMLEKTITPETLIFERENGTTPVPDSVSHAFTKYASKAGVAGVHLHDLRHTHSSLMMKGDINPKVVAERLGHSSVAFTLDTYSHVAPGLQRAAAIKFDEILSKEKANSRLNTSEAAG